MARPARSPFWISLLLSLSVFASHALAGPAPGTELEDLFRKIESRHYRWIAIRAEVLLFFAKADDPDAMCRGELLYQRLDERMILTCADTRQERVFVFRTLDRRFDLYLPAQKTVYHGSIFDLEDSPDLSSHLKARDLYRALKPLAMDPRRTKIDRTNSAITSLDVYGQGNDKDKLVRKLYLTPEGDVRGELFYNAKGRPVTEIQRYDFRELRGHAGSYDSVIFPKKITILSPETKKGSAIFFSKVTALDTVDPLDFLLRVPPGTREVFLDEKDPRHKSPKTSAKITAVTAPPKEMPVYWAKPRKNPGTKKTKPSAREKKETPKTPEPVAAPVLPAPVGATPSPSADADRVLKDPPPEGPVPGSLDQTTLDPSVDPSVEMGNP